MSSVNFQNNRVVHRNVTSTIQLGDDRNTLIRATNDKLDSNNTKLDELKNQQDGVIGAINNTSIGDGTLGQRTYVYAHDVANGQARALKCDADGHLQIDVLSAPAATGSATLAEQQSQTGLLTTIDTSSTTISTKITGLKNSQSENGLGGGDELGVMTNDIRSNTSLTNSTLASISSDTANIDNKIPSQGQALMTASLPVAIASNQSAISVDGSSVTQPVSASSLPLPTGAATESSLSSLNGKVTACDTGSIAGSVTANAGTNLNTSALALESTLSSLNGKVTACDTGSIAGSVTANAGTNLNTSALALESTLSSLNGKVTACDTGSIAGSVTANAGTNLNTSALALESTLSSLNGKVTACDTGSIAGSVTANAGTNLNTSALALESGGNLATVAGDTTSLNGKITNGSDATLSTAQQVLCYGNNGGTLHPVHVTSSGDVDVEIADFVKGNTTASASFPVTDARNKVADVSFLSTELIGASSLSSTSLDTLGYAKVVIYGEQDSGTTVSNNSLKIMGSSTSAGTYFHIGSLSTQTYIPGRTMLIENVPLLYGSHPRYLKIYNDGASSATITIRAILSDFNEYQ